jgi:hypothetical protein
VTLFLRRVPVVQLLGRARYRFSRLAVAVLLSLGVVLTASACGMNVQTNKPYTPADGINLDVGSVHVRNLMILSRTAGEGFLSASLMSTGTDALVGVSGNAIKSDGSQGAAITATVPNPVALGTNKLVVLTQRSQITLKSADLQPGLTAQLVLTFSAAGEVTVLAPVVDANQPDYSTITPSASPSA